MKKVIGIAGYIGAGKTEAGRYFEQLGAHFIDADDVVDDLYQKGRAGYRKMVNFFGDEFLGKDDELDREKIARFVFRDRHKLEILNNLVHPLVASEVQKRIDASDKTLIVVEATYFKPRHLGRLVDEIVWIDAKKEVLKQRVLPRPGMDEALFSMIYRSQSQPQQVTITVENNDDLPSFRAKLKKIWEKWQ